MTIPRMTATLLYALCLSATACDSGDGDMNANATGASGSMTDPATTDAMDPAEMPATTGPTTDGDADTHGGSTSGNAEPSTGQAESTGTAMETADGSARFEDVITETGMQALLDLETSLLWVNDANACNPLGAPNEGTAMAAMEYCDDLAFAGFDDWRMPSSDEASELITAALEESVDLIYANPGCPAVITMGGAAVQTHNGEMPGAEVEAPPSLGVRCVRMN